MKTTENNYNTSKDYDLLHSLIVDTKLMLVCFVNYKIISDSWYQNDRDIAIVSVNDFNRYSIIVRGIGYDSYIEVPNKSKFIEMCEKLKLTFIEPPKIEVK